jgi:heptosyltransferase-3
MRSTRNNILVVKLRHIGDVILTIPVFEALRYHYPEAYIAALVHEDAAPVLEYSPSINRVFKLSRFSDPLRRLRGQMELITRLRKQRFDLVLDLSRSDRGAFYSFVTGAGRRLGFKARQKKIFDRHLLFTDLVTPPGVQHIVEYHLEMVRHLDLSIPRTDIALYRDRSEEGVCEEILNRNGIFPNDNCVVVHPCSRDGHKAWHVGGYAQVCDHMERQWGIKPILVGGNDQVECSLRERIVETATSPLVDLGGQLSLKQLAVVSSRSLLFVGIDSGPMHIASAVGTPVVAIFGPSRRFRWGPWGEGHEVIQKDWPCVPCGKKGCGGSGTSRCLDELSVEEVIAVLDPKIQSVLSGKDKRSNEAQA